MDSSSSGSSSAGGGSSGEPRLDMGGGPDLGPAQPQGCQGKVDFLFVISRQGFMGEIQAQLLDAFPKFIATIQTKFAEFDYHVMVVDGDPFWGLSTCDAECPNIDPDGLCGLPDEYPCDLVDTVTACDRSWGAGVVFNAGSLATNKPCAIEGGKRYLTKGHPELAETFDCLARVGESGADLLGAAFTAAISPELNGPGGCNEGFLRDDALLFVTFVTASSDTDSMGTPEDWAASAIAAKHGDPNAIVMFGIIDQLSQKWCETQDYSRLCQLIRQFPYWSSIDCDEPDFGPGFDAATDMLVEACGAFIPG